MPIVELQNTLIEKACANNHVKPVLEHVQIDLDNNHAVAADGYIAAIVPIADAVPADEPGTYLVDKELLEIARSKDAQDIRIEIDATSARLENVTIKSYDGDLGFPDVDKVFAYVKEHKDEYIFACTIDARRLLKLAEAICTDQEFPMINLFVILDVFASVYVEPMDESIGSKGLIMQCKSIDPKTHQSKPIEIKNL